MYTPSIYVSVIGGILSPKLYDKCEDFPYIYSNIPDSPAYGVYISILIRYARSCSSFGDFIDRGMLLTNKIVDQGYALEKLKKVSFRLFECLVGSFIRPPEVQEG